MGRILVSTYLSVRVFRWLEEEGRRANRRKNSIIEEAIQAYEGYCPNWQEESSNSWSRLPKGKGEASRKITTTLTAETHQLLVRRAQKRKQPICLLIEAAIQWHLDQKARVSLISADAMNRFSEVLETPSLLKKEISLQGWNHPSESKSLSDVPDIGFVWVDSPIWILACFKREDRVTRLSDQSHGLISSFQKSKRIGLVTARIVEEVRDQLLNFEENPEKALHRFHGLWGGPIKCVPLLIEDLDEAAELTAKYGWHYGAVAEFLAVKRVSAGSFSMVTLSDRYSGVATHFKIPIYAPRLKTEKEAVDFR